MERLNPTDLATYLAVTALLVATPGLATAVVLRNTLASGRGAGFATALGVAFANGGYALLAGGGFVAFLVARPEWVLGLRRGGAVLLALLGLQSLWRAFFPRSEAADPAAPTTRVRRRGFAEGAITNSLNPSVAIFYATYVPRFAFSDGSSAAAAGGFGARFAILALLHIGLALSVHSAYALSLGGFAGALSRPRARRILQAIAGVAFIALAVSSWAVI